MDPSTHCFYSISKFNNARQLLFQKLVNTNIENKNLHNRQMTTYLLTRNIDEQL